MIINGKTESELNVICDKPIIDKSCYSTSEGLWNGSLVPIKSNFKETYRIFRCVFAFLAKDNKTLLKNISKFIEEVKSCTIEYEGFLYDLQLKSKDITPDDYENAESVSLEFDVLDMYEAEKSITTKQSTTININSPKPCYANLELSASTSVISYTVNINDTEIVVNNIKGNETVYIGSGKVIAGGKSKINDVDIWEFPILNPGTNKIEVNRSDVDLTIKYCERW